MRERNVERYLCQRVKAAGGETRKLKWIGRAHAPDRIVLLWGLHLVELKRPGKTFRKGQEREALRIARLARVTVWLIDTVEDVDDFIDEVRRT